MTIPNKKQRRLALLVALLILTLSTLACTTEIPSGNEPTPRPPTATRRPTATVTRPSPTPDSAGSTARVLSVVDGDTIEVSLNGETRRLRYIGINTPERGQPYYEDAVRVNRQLVDGKTVRLEFDLDTFDQYGRSLAYVWVDETMVNREIIRLGFANAFTVPPNVRYETLFRAAEQEARQAGRGLWAGSPVRLKIVQIQADAPGNDNGNPNGEWIEVKNEDNQTVSLQGYTLKDEANHIYTFGRFSLRPGASFRLYSGRGQDSPSELYWGYAGESVWNNDHDSAFLRDTGGALVDTFSY